jgi:hypothetical protein
MTLRDDQLAERSALRAQLATLRRALVPDPVRIASVETQIATLVANIEAADTRVHDGSTLTDTLAYRAPAQLETAKLLALSGTVGG